jgi:hypothetical protein
MSYLANATKTSSGYHLLWSVRVGSLSSGPELPKRFATWADLISYLRTRTTDFHESDEATLRGRLESWDGYLMELNPTRQEEDEWRVLTSVKFHAS